MNLDFDVLTFEAADFMLKKRSKTYQKLADFVTNHGGYQITSEKQEWYGFWHLGRRAISIRPDVKGALMVSVLAFEMTNAFQSNEHLKIDKDARNGRINQKQFVERHETVEYQGALVHCKILKELSYVFGELPEEMFILNKPPNKKDLTSWIFPDVKSFLKAQNDSGHSDHYKRWYFHQRSSHQKS